jgi:hypothetical protein
MRVFPVVPRVFAQIFCLFALLCSFSRASFGAVVSPGRVAQLLSAIDTFDPKNDQDFGRDVAHVDVDLDGTICFLTFGVNPTL